MILLVTSIKTNEDARNALGASFVLPEGVVGVNKKQVVKSPPTVVEVGMVPGQRSLAAVASV